MSTPSSEVICGPSATDGSQTKLIWLDILPNDVCERIVLHASGRHQAEDALPLGETNAKFRCAVASVLQRRMRFTDAATAHTRRWCDLLLPDVEEVEVKASSSSFDRSCLGDILTAPTLRCASIIDDIFPLRAIASSNSIRELEVRVQGYPREAGIAQELLLQIFSTLNLTKLRLICCVEREVTSCPFIEAQYLDPHRDDFPSCFSTLQTLDIDCARAKIGDCDPTWRIFPALTSLRDLGFHGELPDGTLLRTQALETVRVKSGLKANEVAISIGAPVKELHMKSALSSAQLKGLETLSNLNILSLQMSPEDDETLSDLLSKLPELRSLDLCWDPPSFCNHGRDDVHTPCYAMPSPRRTFRAIEKTKSLQELKLRDVRLSRLELLDILEHVGTNLKVFWISISDQDETQLDRLEALLYCAAVKNPGLCDFRIPDVHRRDGYNTRKNGRIQGLRLRQAMERLQSHAPEMDTTNIAQAVERAI